MRSTTAMGVKGTAVRYFNAWNKHWNYVSHTGDAIWIWSTGWLPYISDADAPGLRLVLDEVNELTVGPLVEFLHRRRTLPEAFRVWWEVGTQCR